MLSPFLVSPLETPYPILPSPASMRVFLHPLTPASLPWHSLTLECSCKPLHEQCPLLPLMPEKVMLYYILCWNHGFLHVYSLIDGLVIESSGDTGRFILLFFPWGSKPLLGSFL